jgi:hypothetical protein
MSEIINIKYASGDYFSKILRILGSGELFGKLITWKNV